MRTQIILFYLLLSIALLSHSCKPTAAKDPEEAVPVVQIPVVDENNFAMKALKNTLAEPFEGVHTSQGRQDGLFPIRSTGVSTAPIVKAGQAFLKSLRPEQQKKAIFSVQDNEWRDWANFDNGLFRRQGISIKEMTRTQREKAYQLLEESLSAKGLQLSKDIMKTDQTLRELNNNDPIYDEELYFFTIMGQPSATEPWGWQIDGHHLIINYFVLGDQVVMTPTFMGGEPIITTSGKYQGNTIFQDEQNLGLKFIQSLPAAQQEKAIILKEKTRNSNQTEAFKDNAVLDYEGLPVAEMSDEHKKTLLHLIDQYISNMREGHAEVKMEEVVEHLDETYFAWVGATDEDAVFYYRIHSPVVLIEFDHQSPVGINTGSRAPTRQHIHTVVRTPNGNDYGKDLLRQHLESSHH